MEYNEFSLKTSDGLTLFGSKWIPDQEPKAIVNLVHGLGEHSGRYKHVVEAFVQAGYMFTAIDMRGHGKSEGPRGHSPSFDALVTDVEFLVKKNRSDYHGIREYLYGHSLGGSVALYYGLTCDNYVDGIIVTSPLIKTGPAVEKSTNGLGRALVDITPASSSTFGLLYSNLCHDSAVLKDYTADPLVHNRISAKMESEMEKKGEWIIDNRMKFKGSILIAVGSSDRILDIKRVENLVSDMQDRITYKVWENLFHEIHNERERAEVIRFNIDWLDQHLN